jgi:hypothetical protein
MVWAVSFLATFPVISLRDQSVKIADNFPKKRRSHVDSDLPSPTCNGQPPSGWRMMLLVSIIDTGMSFDAPGTKATG